MKKQTVSAAAKLCLLCGICCAAFSCQSSKNISGIYKAGRYSLWEQGTKFVLQGKTSFRSGTELSLNPDATFTFKTCGCESEGSWRKVDNTVILTHETTTVLNDSVTAVVNGKEISASRTCIFPQAYYIKNNTLYRSMYYKTKHVEALKPVSRQEI